MSNFFKENMRIEIIIIVVSLIIAFVVVFILKSMMKTVGKKSRATEYLEEGSFNLSHESDVYLYSDTKSKPKKKS